MTNITKTNTNVFSDKTSHSFGGSHEPLFLCSDSEHSALSASERHSLVKASKSPTSEDLMDLALQKQAFLQDCQRSQHNHEWMLKTGEIPEPQFIDYTPSKQVTPLNSPGCRAIVEFKEWADEWRLRTEVDGQNLNPPEQAGTRISDMLSHRGASKIAESCAYMNVEHGGYKTFVTGTFTPEVREKINSGETTIQKEVSRTMDGLQKMYQRGWTTSDGERVAGNPNGLPYCWVVEVPKNEQGEDNPHIHMLLGWRVEYKHFAEWSSRIEKLWGNGYFHLEKIKDSTCAGAYMAKAAGYMSKAQDNDTQGEVKGNRYGISAIARAPGWALYAKAQLHIVSQLIVDVYDHLTQKYGEKYRERKKLNSALSKIPKAKKALRHHIGKKLAKVRNELNELPIRCNKYQAVIKGRGHAYRFLNWCVNEEDAGNDWLPEKEPGMAWQTGERPQAKDSLYFTKLREQIQRRKFWRRLRYIPEWIFQTDGEWQQVKTGYEIDREIDKTLDTVPEPTGSVWDEYRETAQSLLTQQEYTHA